MKEILLYYPLYDFTAADFITAMDEVKDDDKVCIRVNSNGGSVEAAWGMIAKCKERKAAGKDTIIKVDGKAYSMAAFFLAFSNDVEALDVSEILIHRAAYPSYVENDPEYFTQEMKASLKRTNDYLRTALAGKISETQLTRITGKTLDDIFNTDTRIDVILSAQQAKEIGLVDRVVSLTAQKRVELTSYYNKAAQGGQKVEPMKALQPETVIPKTTKNDTKMTLAEIRAQHPELVAQIADDAVKAERDRVGAFMTFIDVDPEAVAKGIKSGETLSATAMAEFTRKQVSAEFLKASAEGSPAPVQTAKPKTGVDDGKTDEQKQIEAFFAEAEKLTKA